MLEAAAGRDSAKERRGPPQSPKLADEQAMATELPGPVGFPSCPEEEMQSSSRFGPRPLYFEKVEDDEDIGAASLDEAEVISLPDFVAVQPRSFDDEARRRVDDSYEALRAKVDGVPSLLEAVDVDGWQLERSQFELVEEVDEDLKELQILLGCCRCPGNRRRLEQALREFEVSLRAKRTWAWFPLKRYEWSGYQYQEPVITLDFHVPGAGALSKEDPGVKYHHRVRKTRLMRDIEPQRSFVEAEGSLWRQVVQVHSICGATRQAMVLSIILTLLPLCAAQQAGMLKTEGTILTESP
ncbi:hypothetical protein AK812_SmicGene10796 [Symbiodinium microadriaticum]|uniref:Uncharacterized protein n=1 Tax=Symbiodinium microadriaticum TaxID=2951 RepID=A0A1Q9EEY0_SYMMI|nr:hypothetical protein AK812_SmicGene10796 [Symbiodinium microadriaticum]